MRRRTSGTPSHVTGIPLALILAALWVSGSCASSNGVPAASSASSLSPPPALDAAVPAATDAAGSRAADRTGIIVNGRVITTSEIEKLAKRLPKANPRLADLDESILLEVARNELAVRALLAETAKLYLSHVTDDLVLRYWANRLQKEEKEIIEELDGLRDELFIEEYVRARMGLSSLKGVSPDYADFVQVTPTEIRNLYNHLYFSDKGPGAMVRVAQFMFPKRAFPDPALMDLAVQRCMDTLKEGTAKEEELEERVKSWRGVIFRIAEIPERGEIGLRPELLEFARTGKAGEASPPIDLEDLKVVEYILDRPSIPAFEECQDKLIEYLRKDKESRIRKAIERELILRADYYPPDLFSSSIEEILRRGNPGASEDRSGGRGP